MLADVARPAARIRVRLLVRHEAEGDFGARPGRDDGLAAFALVAAGQAVDFERGPGGALFGGREAAFAKQFRHAEELFAFRCRVVRQAGQLFALVGGERRDVIVEAGDGDAPVLVAELCASNWHSAIAGLSTAPPKMPECRSREGPCRIISTATMPRKRVGQRGMFEAGHAVVGDHDARRSASSVAFFFRNPPRFLLPTSSSPSMTNVRSQGKFRAGLQIRFDRVQVREVLAFVVARRRGRRRGRLRCAARTAAISKARTARRAAHRSGHRRESAALRRGSGAESSPRRWDCRRSGEASSPDRCRGNASPASSRRRPGPSCASAARRRWESGRNRTARGRNALRSFSGNRGRLARAGCSKGK